jgi:alkylhydroperoxidase family enzyme
VSNVASEEIEMPRVPVHTIETAPDASRTLLQAELSGPGAIGRILNVQAQLAHSPAVLAAYLGIRRSIEEHATLDMRTRIAVQLTVATVDDCAYGQAINMMLFKRSGATDEEVAALAAGRFAADEKLEALLAVAREAAAHSGRVDDARWSDALDAGWTDTQLTETFVCIALTSFIDSFVCYARTDLDVPIQPLPAGA